MRQNQSPEGGRGWGGPGCQQQAGCRAPSGVGRTGAGPQAHEDTEGAVGTSGHREAQVVLTGWAPGACQLVYQRLTQGHTGPGLLGGGWEGPIVGREQLLATPGPEPGSRRAGTPRTRSPGTRPWNSSGEFSARPGAGTGPWHTRPGVGVGGTSPTGLTRMMPGSPSTPTGLPRPGRRPRAAEGTDHSSLGRGAPLPAWHPQSEGGIQRPRPAWHSRR